MSEIRSRTSRFNCETATFAKVTLHDFIYKHKCVVGWDAFFNIVGVENQLKKISNSIQFGKIKQIKKRIKKIKKQPEKLLKNNISPKLANVFRAFDVPPASIKVVILGQDPTPQPDKATGLAFSVEGDAREVPSVFNLLLELRLEGITTDLVNGDLSGWVDEGVFLLNTALTIPQGGKAGQHLNLWAPFTGHLLKYISELKLPSSRAWILWGQKAINIADLNVKWGKVNGVDNYKVEGSHPSSMGGSYTKFLGGNYFKCANKFLKNKKIVEVDWDVPGTGNIMEKCP